MATSSPSKEASQIEQQIRKIDKKKELCILDFLDSYSSDVLVREYVTLLLKNKVLPKIPENPEDYFHTKTNFDLSVEAHDIIINNFMNYFQVDYFQNNVVDAMSRNLALFNPINNFWTPQFHLLPENTLNMITKIKEAYVAQIQNQSLEGSNFSKELILLRIIDRIFSELVGPNRNFKFYSYQFCLHYMKAKCEFLKTYPIKSIDWDKKKTKIVHSKPKWRKEIPLAIPTKFNNHYAKSISVRIKNGQESFSFKDVMKDVENFQTMSKQSTSDQVQDSNSKVRPIPVSNFNSKRKKAKAKRKSVKSDRQPEIPNRTQYPSTSQIQELIQDDDSTHNRIQHVKEPNVKFSLPGSKS